tara:strand:- start:4355 stop:4954 length:600 start_codon:yes stop_codon:yes gene_type:complete
MAEFNSKTAQVSQDINLSKENKSESLNCPICLDVIENEDIISCDECSYQFCKGCITNQIKNGIFNCPTCRKEFTNNKLLLFVDSNELNKIKQDKINKKITQDNEESEQLALRLQRDELRETLENLECAEFIMEQLKFDELDLDEREVKNIEIMEKIRDVKENKIVVEIANQDENITVKLSPYNCGHCTSTHISIEKIEK